MKRLLAPVTAALITCMQAAIAAPPTTVIVGVNVLTMEAAEIRQGQQVTIEGHVIKSVARAGSIPIPESATVIQGDNKWLMPGLIDMHVHIGFSINRRGIAEIGPEKLEKATTDELFLFLGHGVTTVRNMQGGPYHLALKKRSENGSIQAPRIFTAGPMVDGRPSWPGGHGILMPGADVRMFVENYVEHGYDFIKVYSGLTDEMYEALLKEARRVGARVVGHIPTVSSIETALKYEQDSIEHLMGLDVALQPDGSSAEPGYFPFRDWAKIDFDKVPLWSARLARSEVWLTPTLTVLTRLYDPADIPAALRQPAMELVSPYRKADWQTAPHYQHATTEMLATIRLGHANRLLMVKALSEAGASIMLGSDASVAFMVPGVSTVDELKNMVNAGMPAYDAVLAATKSPAAYLGFQGRLGVIRAGALADLILLDGNPLTDITCLDRVVGVMKNGAWLSKEDINDRLQSIVQWNEAEAHSFQ